MVREEAGQIPRDEPVQSTNTIFSPGFKSVAAMAGWDEEALLTATLIVDDTPDRESKHKKRTELPFKTPPSNSRRKRRPQRSPLSIPICVLDLDGEETVKDDTKKGKEESTIVVEEGKKTGEKVSPTQKSEASCSKTSLPCLDKLKEELSCAICLDICFEPSTTPCGHSFCKKCLQSAADKCGKKCPKCRQLISNRRSSCTVNTVLWNTIQLLFPKEVEARKAAGALNSREAESQIPETTFYHNTRNRSSQTQGLSSRDETTRRRRATPNRNEEHTVILDGDVPGNVRTIRPSSRGNSSRNSRRTPSQDGDAALALRLQREEFLGTFGVTLPQSRTRTRTTTFPFVTATALAAPRPDPLFLARESTNSEARASSLSVASFDSEARANSLSVARANLRAMASRAISNIRVRSQNF
ncbi:hypothetical protein UlMin_013735 [Ulmus minor]